MSLLVWVSPRTCRWLSGLLAEEQCVCVDTNAKLESGRGGAFRLWHRSEKLGFDEHVKTTSPFLLCSLPKSDHTNPVMYRQYISPFYVIKRHVLINYNSCSTTLASKLSVFYSICFIQRFLTLEMQNDNRNMDDLHKHIRLNCIFSSYIEWRVQISLKEWGALGLYQGDSNYTWVYFLWAGICFYFRSVNILQ